MVWITLPEHALPLDYAWITPRQKVDYPARALCCDLGSWPRTCRPAAAGAGGGGGGGGGAGDSGAGGGAAAGASGLTENMLGTEYKARNFNDA